MACVCARCSLHPYTPDDEIPDIFIPEHARVIAVNRSVVRHFGTLAQKNRLVFVEALFQHPHPKPFCEALCNVYHDAEFGNTEVSA